VPRGVAVVRAWAYRGCTQGLAHCSGPMGRERGRGGARGRERDRTAEEGSLEGLCRGGEGGGKLR